MKKIIIAIIVFCILAAAAVLIYAGVKGKEKQTAEKGLTIKSKPRFAEGDDSTEVSLYESPQVGDKVFEKYSTIISVKAVEDDKIILSIDGGPMVKPNKDGTINLRAEPLKDVTIEKGNMTELKSQGTDMGFTLYITYN